MKTLIAAAILNNLVLSEQLLTSEPKDINDFITLVDEYERTKEKDNVVYFEGANIAFQLYSASVTSGVPYSGVTVSGDSLDVHVGRKVSSTPAQAFNIGLAESNVLALGSPKSTVPSELNFSISGDMTFSFASGQSVTCTDFRIAQGSYGNAFTNHNNWYVASSDCIQTASGLSCCCGNEACDINDSTTYSNFEVAITKGGNDNEFVVNEFTS